MILFEHHNSVRLRVQHAAKMLSFNYKGREWDGNGVHHVCHKITEQEI